MGNTGRSGTGNRVQEATGMNTSLYSILGGVVAQPDRNTSSIVNPRVFNYNSRYVGGQWVIVHYNDIRWQL